MAYITTYSTFFRAHPITLTKPCRADKGFVELGGVWFDPALQNIEVRWSREERENFLKEQSILARGTSTYMDHYCSRIRKEALKKKEEEDRIRKEAKEQRGKRKKASSSKDNELMKSMKSIFERDDNRLVVKPLKTQQRVMGYCRPARYQCDLSVYQKDIGFPGYVCMRDSLVKPTEVENNHRPRTLIRPMYALPDGERLLV